MANRTTRIRALYERIPNINCKGLCIESCGPLLIASAERYMMVQAGGEPELSGDQCPYLSDGRCSIYECRPLICRLWGVDDMMPCRFGCEIEGERLTAEESHALIQELSAIDGKPEPTPLLGTLEEHFQRVAEIESRS